MPTCNPSKGAVVMDGLIAGLFGLGALAAAGAEEGDAAATLAVGGVLFTGSGVYGSSSANRCRRALAMAGAARHEERARDEERESERAAVVATEPETGTATAAAATTATTTATTEVEEAATTEVEEETGAWPDFWEAVP